MCATVPEDGLFIDEGIGLVLTLGSVDVTAIRFETFGNFEVTDGFSGLIPVERALIGVLAPLIVRRFGVGFPLERACIVGRAHGLEKFPGEVDGLLFIEFRLKPDAPIPEVTEESVDGRDPEDWLWNFQESLFETAISGSTELVREATDEVFVFLDRLFEVTHRSITLKIPVVVHIEVAERKNVGMSEMKRANMLGDCNERLTAIVRVVPDGHFIVRAEANVIVIVNVKLIARKVVRLRKIECLLESRVENVI